MLARVHVTLKSGVLDPQGEAILKALGRLGHDSVSSVRQGKFFDIELQAKEATLAKQEVSAMADKLLANTVIEDFSVSIL